MCLFEVGLAVAAVIGLVLSIAAYFLLASALWPRLVGAVEARFTRAPLVSIVTGLPLAVVSQRLGNPRVDVVFPGLA